MPFVPPREREGEIRSYIDAGMAVRGAVKNALKQAAFDAGVRIDIEEDKRWLGSTYYFTVSGPLSRVDAWGKWFNRWVAANEK